MAEKEFLAKSYTEETIQEHTDKVLQEYERLKKFYKNCNVNWTLLEQACLYHDLGKMNSKFQRKIRNAEKVKDEVPHGILSTLFLDAKRLKEDFQGADDFKSFDDLDDAMYLLFSTIFYHHDRESFEKSDFTDNLEKNINREKDSLQYIVKNFKYDKVRIPEKLHFRDKYISRFSNSDKSYLLGEYVLLKGCLNRVDYAASAHVPVEIENDFLENKLDCFMEKLQKRAVDENRDEPKWNDLQKFMKDNKDENLVAIAQTGMGKTEAGLWWIGNNKGFFTLPVRTAINAIYMRIKEEILDNKFIEERLGLLHGETRGIYLQLQGESDENLDIENYFTVTKQLSLPLTVCTVDQLFTTVFRYRGYEAKLATLSYSKIVIDEIQMYGPEIIGFLICGLKMVTELGGRFVIMTATFPGFLRDIMESYGLKFIMPEPFVDEKRIRHSVEWHEEGITADFIFEKYNNNRVLVVCNTVNKCKEVYKELSNKMDLQENSSDSKSIDESELNMLHGKYIYKDRIEKEKAILSFGKIDEGGTKDNRKGIWIASSIAEASLDVDFDILITELSDVNGLFQRMGRCYRKRSWNGDGANCYVFDGGEKKCSGAGYNIDENIFELSKEKLREYFKTASRELREIDKMNLVRDIYSTENMKGSKCRKYYDKIKKCIEQPTLYLPAENTKPDAQKLFRDITTETVIPLVVFENNRDEIEILEKSLSDRNLSMEEKIENREKLKAFTLGIERYQLENVRPKATIKLGKYEEIKIIDAEYNPEMGLISITKESKEIESNII